MRQVTMRLLLILILAYTGGCASFLEAPDSRAEADQRWRKVRARLKYQLAVDHYEKGRLDETHASLREVIGLYPDFADAFVLLARLRLEKGETAAASEALDQALRHGGDSPETDYLNGMIAQRYERLDLALEWYQRAMDRDPNDAQYVLAVAETLVALDRSEEALRLVTSRRPDFDNRAALPALAGKIHMMRSYYEGAVEAFRAAHRIDRADTMVASDLAMAMVFAEHYTDARDVLLDIEHRNGDLPALLRMALARCYRKLGAPEAARAEYRRVVEQDPQHVEGWRGLAEAALENQDLMTSRRAAAQCYELVPGNGQYALLYGFVCYRQKDDAEAISALRVAVGLLEDDPMAHCLLGRSLQRLGRSEEARRSYQRAIAIQPGYPWARQLLEQLSDENAETRT